MKPINLILTFAYFLPNVSLFYRKIPIVDVCCMALDSSGYVHIENDAQGFHLTLFVSSYSNRYDVRSFSKNSSFHVFLDHSLDCGSASEHPFKFSSICNFMNVIFVYFDWSFSSLIYIHLQMSKQIGTPLYHNQLVLNVQIL